MEKQILIISKVFFFVALNMLLLILVTPLQAWSNQTRQHPVWLHSPYQQDDNIIKKNKSTLFPFPLVSEPALSGQNQAAGRLTKEAAAKPAPIDFSAIAASPNNDRQKLLLMLLLIASSNKLPGS